MAFKSIFNKPDAVRGDEPDYSNNQTAPASSSFSSYSAVNTEHAAAPVQESSYQAEPSYSAPAATSSAGNSNFAPAGVNVCNVLNSDVKVTGDLSFSDDLLIDGFVEGSISSSGVLTVGESGEIKGTINTGSVIVHGKVFGNITATERIELKSTAHVIGDIRADKLAIELGAVFSGSTQVGVASVADNLELS